MPAPAQDFELLNALAAMRSAAEVLRDFGDLAPDERRRFANIVVAEGRRVEFLIQHATPV